MKTRTQSIWFTVFKAVFSGALVWLVVSRVHLDEVVGLLKKIDLRYVGGGVLCYVAATVVSGQRWKILTEGLITFSQSLKYTWIGLLYSTILPGAISGEVAKGMSLAVKIKEARVGMLPLSIVMDRIIGFVVLLCFFNLSCAVLLVSGNPLSSMGRPAILSAFYASAGVLLGCALFVSPWLKKSSYGWIGFFPWPKIRGWLDMAHRGLFYYTNRPGILMKALALSILVHSLNLTQMFLVLRSLDIQMGLLALVTFYSLVSVLIMVPITISGLGIRDGFSFLFFQTIGADGQGGVAFAWLSTLLLWLMALVGAMVQVWEWLVSGGVFAGSRPPSDQEPDNQGIYDQHWAEWTDMKAYGPASRWQRQLIGDLLGFIRDPQEVKKILDCGCGEGTTTSFLAQRFPGAEVLGIDPSSSGIDMAEKRYKQRNLQFQCVDKLGPMGSGQYDLVTCFEVLEHIDEWRLFAEELVMTSRRYLLLSFPTGHMRDFERNIGHYRNFRIGEIEQFMQIHGCRSVRVNYAGFPFYSPLFRNLYNVAGPHLQKYATGRFFWGKRAVSRLIYVLFRYFSTRTRMGDQFCGLFEKCERNKTAPKATG